MRQSELSDLRKIQKELLFLIFKQKAGEQWEKNGFLTKEIFLQVFFLT